MGPMIYQETYKDAKNDTGHGAFVGIMTLVILIVQDIFSISIKKAFGDFIRKQKL